MKSNRTAPLFGATIIALAALLAACGGGGGGGGTNPPTGGGGGTGTTPTPSSTATPVVTPTPTATPPPASVAGTMAVGNTPASQIVFTCGCSAEGGLITPGSNGSYTITNTGVTAIPSSPQPYVPPGKNIMVVGYTNTGTQTWTMDYFADTPANDLNIGAAGNASDTASTAAALFVYYEDSYVVTGSDRSFDWFNFLQIQNFANKLRSGTNLTTPETQFMTDIQNAQNAGLSLYTGPVPKWNDQQGATTNNTLYYDAKAIAIQNPQDPLVPLPCAAPNNCTAPTPAP